jgi:hypothetical protein
MLKSSRSPAEAGGKMRKNKMMMIDPQRLPAKCPGSDPMASIA